MHEHFTANLGVGGPKEMGTPDETTVNNIKVACQADSSFMVTNSRNGHYKDYGPHK